MAITATFTADFSDFTREVKAAEFSLEAFEFQTVDTGKALDTMGTISDTAAPKVGGLASTARQFDQTLGALGINIGPVTRAIGEIEAVAGKSASALGALGTAGAILSAAVAGWQIGRKIAEALNTDQIIGNAVAKWMGWGDVAAETAAAVADAAKYAAERTVPEVQKITKAFEVDAATQAKWIAEQNKEWGAALAIRDRFFGEDAIKKANDYGKAISGFTLMLGDLTKHQLVELQTAMLEGIDALVRSGRATDAQADAFAKLAVLAGEALAALRPVVEVTEDLIKAQWDYVTALDEANAKQATQTEEIKKTSAAASELANRPAGGGLMPTGIVGSGGVARDQYGRPVVPGGAISGLPIVNVNINAPLGTPDQIAGAVGGAMTNSYSRGGQRLPA